VRRLLIPETLAPIGPDAVPAGPVERVGGRTMGTTWSVAVVTRRPGEGIAVRDLVEVELARLVARFSHWYPDSDLCRFNRAPAGSRVSLQPDLFHVIEAACRVADASEGAYDPTLGALVDLWGFGPPGPVDRPPDEAAIAAALARSGWRHLALDRRDRSAFQPGGLQLDLSGSAKGHAVDAVSDLLLAEGFANHLVEIGGELRGRGLKPDRQPWWVALEAPFGDGDTVAALHDLAVASSGDHRRGRDLAGSRIGHTLDGRTGRPIANGVSGATVLHASCLMADALATAIMVLGPERGRAFAAAHDLACLTGGQGTPDWDWISPAAQRMMA
jgi:thiamine biosynthesis lipoprotein